MDKSKFLTMATYDSEGFPMELDYMLSASMWLQKHNQLHWEAAQAAKRRRAMDEAFDLMIRECFKHA